MLILYIKKLFSFYMIKEKNVLVSVNSRNISHYKLLGYDISIGGFSDKKMLEVKIEDIPKNSKIKITSICDICGNENLISVSKYYSNYERGGYNFYSCFKCKNKKREMTNLKMFGVKSFSETDTFKEKYKKTCLNKYGVENPNKLDHFRQKTKKTCLKKYGFTNPLIRPEVIESNRLWMSSNEFKSKSKITIMKKWGYDSYSKTDEFKKRIQIQKEEIVSKIRSSFLEKYGVDSIFKTKDWKINYLNKIDEIKEKKVETCLKRYGVENVSQISEIYDKIIKTKIDNKQIISDSKLPDWKIYQKKVRKITNRSKKILFQNWNGIDYYDNENIKSYFSYSHTHRFYPCVDHKISVFYGFNNKIEPEVIGDVDNLCVTKRYINSIKGNLIEEEFINQ